jgi:hypothetical protein
VFKGTSIIGELSEFQNISFFLCAIPSICVCVSNEKYKSQELSWNHGNSVWKDFKDNFRLYVVNVKVHKKLMKTMFKYIILSWGFSSVEWLLSLACINSGVRFSSSHIHAIDLMVKSISMLFAVTDLKRQIALIFIIIFYVLNYVFSFELIHLFSLCLLCILVSSIDYCGIKINICK